MSSRSLGAPQPRPELLAIDAYVPGKSAVAGVEKIYKLSSNESPLGPSPQAVRMFAEEASRLALYPEGSSSALRAAIAERYGLDSEQIICGNGSDEILALLGQTFLRPGDEGLYSEYGFLEYPIIIRAAGATPVVAPEIDMKASVDNLLAKVTARTRIVFIANPNNPTGSYLPFDEIKRLHTGLPTNVLLVIDAAYAEYVRKNDYAAGLELVSSSDNVVMTRTFSKIHGLANVRLGWAYGPREVISVLNRIRGPFNVNGPAQAAGVAAIRDRAHEEAAVEHNERWLPWLTKEIVALGLSVAPSVGNFVLIKFPETKGLTAGAADVFLASRGYILRAVKGYGLPHCLRLTVGTEEANRGFMEALRLFMRERSGG